MQEQDLTVNPSSAGHGPSTRDQPSRRLDTNPPTARPRRQADQHTAITRSQVHHQIRPLDPYPFDQEINYNSWSRAPRRETNCGEINDIDTVLTGHAPARDDKTSQVFTDRNSTHGIHLLHQITTGKIHTPAPGDTPTYLP